MELNEKLKQRFSAASLHRKLVFWYDNNPEREFEPIKSALASIGVKVWELTPKSVFTTKYQLEVLDPEQPYLIYSRHPKPDKLHNWLLDILLYSEEFSADDIAVLMQRLGIEQLAVRDLLEQHRSFFRSNERVSRLQKLLPNSPNQEQLVLGMLAVLTSTDSLYLPAIVRSVLLQGLDCSTNKAYQDIRKFFSEPVFWGLVRNHFGLIGDTITLEQLFRTLVVNHFQLELDFELSLRWNEQFTAYASTLANTCRIFIEDWKHAPEAVREVLNNYLAELQMEWDIGELLAEQPCELYQRCDTFPVTEVLFIQRLTVELEQETANVAHWNALLNIRRTRQWYSREPYAGLYRALEAALGFMDLANQFAALRAPVTGKAWVEQYTGHLHRIDRYYRLFMTAVLSSHTPERLQVLRERVENYYVHHYLVQVACWTDALLDAGLLENWPVPGVVQQQDFYQEYIDPLVRKSSERIFVIISDALRYEAGAELVGRLQKRLNAEVGLTPLQVALPSCTQLGMACLLPGDRLSIQDKSVLQDGFSTQGLDNRETVLQKREPLSRALKLQHLIALKYEEGQALLRNRRVVYLYHDVIDAIGDNQKSEQYTFRAVEDTLNELAGAVDKLVRTYAAVRIFITGDHGFLFQTGAVEALDKITAVSGQVLDGNRRFALGHNLSVPAGARKLSLAYLGLAEEAVIATGLNRFQVSGGARFVHGGAMPQEALVPVITYRQIRGQAKLEEQPYVNVRLATKERVITSYRFKATFFQEQKAEDSFLSRQLRAALYWDGERISNEITLTFDSREEPGRRYLEVIFSLREQPYLMGERCVLRMEDVSTARTRLYREEELELRIYNSF